MPQDKGGSERAHGQTGGERLTQIAAGGEISVREGFRGEDRLGGLGVRADDERVLHGAQAPAGRDAGQLAGGVGAVRTCADHLRVSPPFDPAQKRVIAAVEKLFHRAGEGCEVLGRAEQIAACGQKIVGGGLIGGQQAGVGLGAGGVKGGLSHLAAAAGAGMIDDHKLGHAGDGSGIGRVTKEVSETAKRPGRGIARALICGIAPDQSRDLTLSATACGVMPNFSYSTSAGAEAPKSCIPMKPDFSRLPRSPNSQRSQPKRIAASTATRTGPPGRTRLRYASSWSSKSSQQGMETTRVPMPSASSRSRACMAMATSEPVAIRSA